MDINPTEYCKPGEWTKNLSEALKVAKQNNRFVFIDWGKSRDCGFCTSAWDDLFSRKEFTNWSKENGIPILYCDDLDTSNLYKAVPLADWIHQRYYNGATTIFPQILILDAFHEQEDAPMCIMKMPMVGNGLWFSRGGYDSVYAQNLQSHEGECPNCTYFTYDIDSFLSSLQYLFCQINQKSEYITDITDTDIVGQFKDHGIRYLGCQNKWIGNTMIPKIKLTNYSSSQFHWFRFQIQNSNTAYSIRILDYVDTEACGKCMIFKSLEKVQHVNSYQSAVDNCDSCFDMNSRSMVFSGLQGTYVYILFTRKDDIPESFESSQGKAFDGYHEFDIRYRFQISHATKTEYSVVFRDYDGKNLKECLVYDGESAIPPENPTRGGYLFTGWSPSYENVKSNLVIIAQYIVDKNNPQQEHSEEGDYSKLNTTVIPIGKFGHESTFHRYSDYNEHKMRVSSNVTRINIQSQNSGGNHV